MNTTDRTSLKWRTDFIRSWVGRQIKLHKTINGSRVRDRIAREFPDLGQADRDRILIAAIGG